MRQLTEIQFEILNEATHRFLSRTVCQVLSLDYKQGNDIPSLFWCLIFIPPSVFFSVANRIRTSSFNTTRASALCVILQSWGEWLSAPVFENPLILQRPQRRCLSFFFKHSSWCGRNTSSSRSEKGLRHGWCVRHLNQPELLGCLVLWGARPLLLHSDCFTLRSPQTDQRSHQCVTWAHHHYTTARMIYRNNESMTSCITSAYC